MLINDYVNVYCTTQPKGDATMSHRNDGWMHSRHVSPPLLQTRLRASVPKCVPRPSPLGVDRLLHFSLFGNFQRVVHLDAEVSHRALQLGVAKQ